MEPDSTSSPRRRRTDQMDLGSFGLSIELARARTRDVSRGLEQIDAPQGPLLAESLDTLDLALEELGVADEELRQQHDALESARDALEQERARYQELFESARDVARASAGELDAQPEGPQVHLVGTSPPGRGREVRFHR